jgi:hypothetical protein
MDDARQAGSTFIDEDLDFDTLLEDDDFQEVSGRTSAIPGVGGSTKAPKRYSPIRLRVTPNWSRIAVAVLVAAVLLFVFGYGIKAWLDHRTANAYKDYLGQVSEIVNRSDAQGQEVSNLLAQPSGADRAQFVARLEKLEARSKALVKDAEAIDAPDGMALADEWLVTTLQYRANGMSALSRAMSNALVAKDREEAAATVAAANERFVASDVIYDDSFTTAARAALRADDVTGVTIPDSQMVDDPEFTSPDAMKLMLDRLRTGIKLTPGQKPEPINDGKIRGGQLGAVTVAPSGETLSTSGTTEIAGSDDLAFEVPFENQGEVQATQVPVVVRISGENVDPVELSGVIDTVDPGQIASVRVPVDEVPIFGEELEVTVTAGPVPGEEVVDNNSATYSVMFRL